MNGTMKLFKVLFLSSLMCAFISCNDTSELDESQELQLPTSFSIDIPSSISNNDFELGGRVSEEGVIKGEDIYRAVPGFIKIGETSAEIIDLALVLGSVLQSSNVRAFTIEDSEDGRAKHFEINEDVVRNGVNYQFEMTAIDVADDELALQLLWNNSPVEGIGVLRPYYLNRSETENPNAFVRINYSEDDPIYDATMTVSVVGLEMENINDPDNIKMFVGRVGDTVDVIGNSNHPNAVIIDDTFSGGRNYAFVGRGNESENIGVIELSLPPSSVQIADVLELYSVYNVLEEEIAAVANLDQSTIDNVLSEAGAPAYFNESGFIASGDTFIDGFSSDFISFEGIQPFVPVEVRDLEVSFLE